MNFQLGRLIAFVILSLLSYSSTFGQTPPTKKDAVVKGTQALQPNAKPNTATLSKANQLPVDKKPQLPILGAAKQLIQDKKTDTVLSVVSPVLFNIGSEAVHADEFEYVYNKNNTDSKTQHTKASVEEYLELYINFRLKVKEAESLGMDTIKSIIDELETYRKQLAKSYLFDREVNEKLLTEAYERMQKEIRASHLLIKIAEPGLPADTLDAYKRVMDLRKRLLKGEDFATLAKTYSEDPSAKTNGGDIGYFTVLQTVYPFETAAYNTAVGEISMPVRTKFGYHLVKVTDSRPAQGEITVQHILVKTAKDATPQQQDEAKKKIDEIYQKAVGGTPFEQLVAQYSDDKSSKGKNGELAPFGTGKMVIEFESAAFALQKDGDISAPIKTDFGWHIIRRVSKKGLPPYESMKAELKKRIERDSRSEIAKNILIGKLKKEYLFTEFPTAKTELLVRIDSSITAKFTMPNKADLDKPLFAISGKGYSQKDLVGYMEDKQKKKRTEPVQKIFNDYYDKFVEESLLAYEESQLERKYPEFKALMKEYRDGILLFELTDQKVWSKAVKDTAGLAKYHEQIKNKYMWDERVNAVIFTVKASEKTLGKIRKYAETHQPEEVALKYNTKSAPNTISYSEDIYEKGQNAAVDKTGWNLVLGENMINKDSTISFVKIMKKVAPTPKSLNEARGFIVSDYQEFLEKQWIQELRNKYPIRVNQETLNTLIKKN
ncbi:MAG: peptidylprolyl isomerase [Chitinophagales bacterium]|nr:peptidylprolyl isomerase [Chitinophagales bacterium]